MQVCLAAETCKHVSFDVRHDAWWSSVGFQCGNHPHADLNYWNIVAKVPPGPLQLPFFASIQVSLKQKK